jgi:hypothetical protein
VRLGTSVLSNVYAKYCVNECADYLDESWITTTWILCVFVEMQTSLSPSSVYLNHIHIRVSCTLHLLEILRKRCAIGNVFNDLYSSSNLNMCARYMDLIT